MAEGLKSFECCGVRIDPMQMEQAVDAVLSPSDPSVGRSVHLCNAYTLSLAQGDPAYLRMLNEGDFNLPDGMPLIWIAERLGIDGLEGRVYGPDLTLATFDAGRAQGARRPPWCRTRSPRRRSRTGGREERVARRWTRHPPWRRQTARKLSP